VRIPVGCEWPPGTATDRVIGLLTEAMARHKGSLVSRTTG
jgi:hypothetical protein